MKTLEYLPSSKFKTDFCCLGWTFTWACLVYPDDLIPCWQNKDQTAQSFSAYLDNGSDSLVMPIIQRHETLSITNQELLQRLGCLEEEVEEGQRRLQTMKQEHNIKKLVRLNTLGYLVQHFFNWQCSNDVFLAVADGQQRTVWTPEWVRNPQREEQAGRS